MNKKLAWCAIGTAVVLIGLAGLLAFATPRASAKSARSAASTYVYNHRGGSAVPMTNGVWIPNGHAVNMTCWLDANSYTGNYTSRRWFYIGWVAATGHWWYGWVHSSYVYNQVRVPHCSFG